MTAIDNSLRALHAARNDPSEAGCLLEKLAVSCGDSVSSLTSALGDGDSEIRSGAAMALGHISFFSEGRCDVTAAIPLLAKATEDSAPWVALHAATALWQIYKEDAISGLNADEAIHRIASCLESSDPSVRAAAAEEFQFVRSHAELVIPHLVDRLDDPVPLVRIASASTLATFGAAATEALPYLMKWIDSDIPEEVFAGTIAVIYIDGAYQGALVPVLLDSFGRLGDTYRAKAVYGLFDLLESEPRLVAMLDRCYRESRDRHVRRAVVDVFSGNVLEVKETLPVLVQALLDEEPDVASAATQGLYALEQVLPDRA